MWFARANNIPSDCVSATRNLVPGRYHSSADFSRTECADCDSQANNSGPVCTGNLIQTRKIDARQTSPEWHRPPQVATLDVSRKACKGSLRVHRLTLDSWLATCS